MANEQGEPFVLDFPNGQRVEDILKKAESDYSKAEIDAKMASKADTADVYSKSDVDAALSNKADKSTTYTKTEVDAALDAKQDTISDISTIRSGAALGATAVQPEAGKGLSSNDYTDADRTKLAGIEAQANKTIVDDALSSSSTNPVQNMVIKSALDNKVDKETGKGLSTNDYTTAEKTKLDSLAEIKRIGTGLNLDANGELTATGGGTGGTDDYEDLINQPQINGNTLLGNKTSAQLGLADVSDIPTTLAELTGDSTHRTVTDTEKATWNAKADVADIPTVPVKGVAKNGTAITPDASGVVNITVPTTAADVSALPDTTKYATALSLTINSSTFVMTGQLKDQNGDNLGTAQTIDLPLESVVVGGSYDSATKKVVLTLQSGNIIEFSVADLVAGLQTELSASNKLNPTFINYDSTHRAVSDAEKTAWNNKSDFSGDYEDLNNLPTIPEALSDLSEDSTHRTVSDAEKSAWNAKASTAIATTSSAGLMSADDKTKLNNIASGAEVNVQSDWNVTSSSSDAYIKNKPTIPSASSASPKMNGTATSGSSSYWSRADHVHPTDTSRQAALSSAQLSAVNSGVTSTTVSHANSVYSAVIPSANSTVSNGDLSSITSNECRVYHNPSNLPSGTTGSVICTTRIFDSNTGYQDLMFITAQNSVYPAYRRTKTSGFWRNWVQITNT